MALEYLGDKLQTLRKSKKLTQSELAEKLGITNWAVASYEQGKSYPSVEILAKICTQMEVSSDYLLGISDDLPLKLGMSGLNEEETRLLLQFLNLMEQNRTQKSEENES